MSSLKLVLKAESIIQRDAILAALKARNIEPHSAPRDISRKIADETVDLGFDAVSAVFDGFAIHVDEKQYDDAKRIAEQIVRAKHRAKDDPALAKGGSMRKFYFCCVFCIPMPFLFHGLAAYHLFMGLKNGERLHPFYGTMSLIVFLSTIALIAYIIGQTDLGHFFRGLAETL